MRKFLIIILSLLLTSISYAKSYDEFIQEAEQYENKKEWFYALGAYYNAMKVSDNSDVAQQKYTELSDCIKSGKPGFGEFNVFSMHDEWVNLIKNAEKYFTETFPYMISYDTLEMDSANYEKKTANYKLGLTVNQSEFYENAREILKNGYEKTNHSDWKDLESEYKSLWFISDGFAMIRHSSWDGSLTSSVDFYRKSVYSTKQEKVNKVSEYPVLQKEANSVYQKDKIALTYLSAPIVPRYEYLSKIAGISVCEVPAFAACFSETMTTYNRQDYSVPLAVPYFKIGKQTCYDLKLGVYDENDNLIVEGNRQTICTDSFSYIFTNIPQDKLSALDSKKYTIKILGIWLNYGVYDISLMTDDDFKNNTIRGIVKPLPDIKIESKNVEFLDKAILEEQKRLAKEAEAKIKADKLAAKQKEWDDFILELENQYNSYEELFNQAKEYSENFAERSGTGIKLTLGSWFNGNYWDYRRQGDCFTVDEVMKKSIATKNKIKEYDKLIKINGIELSDLKAQSREIIQKYEKLSSLIYKTRYSNSDYLSNFKQQYETIELKDLDILLLENPKIEDGWYLAPLKAGTVLTFQDRSNEYKTIEIVVP